jgi:hypothetical protein
VLFSLPSNLNSSPYFTDHGNTIELKPDPVISTCLNPWSYKSFRVGFEDVIAYNLVLSGYPHNELIPEEVTWVLVGDGIWLTLKYDVLGL